MTTRPRDQQLPLRCSFCEFAKAGGVAGPTPDVYICPECIRLAAEIVELQGAVEKKGADRG